LRDSLDKKLRDGLMAAIEPEAPPRGSAEFVESAVLEAIVPAASSIGIEDLLQSWDGSVDDENASILPFISQRQFLLFGKRLHGSSLCASPLTYS
jgi:hypothetical protein